MHERFKSLYDANERLTESGQQLQTDVSRELQAIMRMYVARGYSPREIAAVMAKSAMEIGSNQVVELPFYNPISSGRMKISK